MKYFDVLSLDNMIIL